MKILLFFLVFITPLLSHGYVYAVPLENQQNVSKRKVLIIYSYRDNLPWQKNVRKGLFSRLNELPRKQRPEIFEERLEVYRLTPIDSEHQLLKLIVEKYKQIKLDLIVTDNDYAFNFLNQHTEAFPNVERIHMTLTKYGDQKNVISIGVNPMSNINLILDLLPQTKQIVVLASNTAAIEGLRASSFNALVQPLAERNIQLKIVSDFSFPELYQQVKSLPENTVILNTPFFMDRLGERKIPKDLLTQLTKLSPVPIFINFDPLLGTGAMGGYVVNSIKVGELIADAIIGTPIPTIQQDISSLTKTYMFDDNALKHWNIDYKKLPADSIIINQKTSVLYKYRWEIGGILVAFCIESFLIIALFYSLKVRKKTAVALEEQRDLLEARVAERTHELKEKNKELEAMASTDPLTGVSNRREYQRRLDIDVANAKRSNSCLSCLMIDVDYFKLYNDCYGHAKGDEVLKQVAHTINQSLPRKTDFVARYGGEEFIVLMPATDSKGAAQIAETIRKNIEALSIPHRYSAISTKVTVSIGVSSLDANELDPVALVKQADEALYRAKGSGRNKYHIFNS